MIRNPYELWTQALSRGENRAQACKPYPMVVEQHANMADDNSPVVYREVVSEGPCGFAWVNIRPARGPLVAWLKANKIGYLDTYSGGWSVWCRGYGQSMTRKEEWAHGVADTLRENGIKAYAHSRMD